MKPLRGLISNIERFAIHDGPGIRTLVFMKGCPLKCLWCSSPQTQNPFPEVMHDAARCQRCGTCAIACPAEAMTLCNDEGVRIDRELCKGCGECIDVCPNQALELVGHHVTVEELSREVNKNSAFYRRSNGGITIGGGAVRSMGLMAAIELVKGKETKEQIGMLPMESPRRIEELMWEKGIYARAIPNESIALAPPFIISEQEIDTIVDALDSSIAQMEKEML